MLQRIESGISDVGVITGGGGFAPSPVVLTSNTKMNNVIPIIPKSLIPITVKPTASVGTKSPAPAKITVPVKTAVVTTTPKIVQTLGAVKTASTPVKASTASTVANASALALAAAGVSKSTTQKIPEVVVRSTKTYWWAVVLVVIGVAAWFGLKSPKRKYSF